MALKKIVKDKLIGRILRCPDYKNELWYLSPIDGKRKLINITNAHIFFKRLFVVIDENELSKIPIAGEQEANKHLTFRKKLKGKIILVRNNDANCWYVGNNLYRSQMSQFDLFDILSSYAININKNKLDSISL